MRIGLIVALVSLPVAAWADMPFVFPQSDTAIVYVTGGVGVRQTLRVSAGLGLQRVDAPGGGMAVITDTVHHTMIVLDNKAHAFSEGPAPPGTADMRGKRAPADYARVGTAAVAGLPCTEWATHDPSGHPVIVCLTDDGVLLRVRDRADILVEAASVEHAAQDPAMFAPPTAWRKVEH